MRIETHARSAPLFSKQSKCTLNSGEFCNCKEHRNSFILPSDLSQSEQAEEVRLLISSWVKLRVVLHVSHFCCRYSDVTGSRERPLQKGFENLVVEILYSFYFTVLILKEDWFKKKKKKSLDFTVPLSLTSLAPPFVSHQCQEDSCILTLPFCSIWNIPYWVLEAAL